jgi:hypothetical protein
MAEMSKFARNGRMIGTHSSLPSSAAALIPFSDDFLQSGVISRTARSHFSQILTLSNRSRWSQQRDKMVEQ